MSQKGKKEKKGKLDKDQKKIEVFLQRGDRVETRRAKIEAAEQRANMADQQGKDKANMAAGKNGAGDENVLQAIEALGTRFETFETEVKGWKTAIDSKITTIESTCNGAAADAGNALTTANEAKAESAAAQSTADDAKAEAEAAKTTIDELTTKLTGLETQFSNWKQKQDIVQNKKDRTYKENNIRILGMAEKTSENTKKEAFNVFKKVYPNIVLNNLEQAFRVKNKDDDDDRPRSVIVRFKERELRNNVFKEMRKNKAKVTGIKITDDMSKADIDLRNKAIPQIKLAIEQGSKAFFYNGKLKIDGVFVPITNSTIVVPPHQVAPQDEGLQSF